jgi:hypothetical protein
VQWASFASHARYSEQRAPVRCGGKITVAQKRSIIKFDRHRKERGLLFVSCSTLAPTLTDLCLRRPTSNPDKTNALDGYVGSQHQKVYTDCKRRKEPAAATAAPLAFPIISFRCGAGHAKFAIESESWELVFDFAVGCCFSRHAAQAKPQASKKPLAYADRRG